MRNGENGFNYLKESSPNNFTEAHKEFKFTARNDYAFKLLFGNPENIIILKEFLSVVLNLEEESFEEIVIENPMVGNYHYEEKQGILDIKLTLRDGKKINVEMQNRYEPNYEKRAHFYWASRYLERFVVGEEYKGLSACIGIHILNDSFSFAPDLHSIYQVRNTQREIRLSEDFELHFLNLTQLKTEALGESALEQWLSFIKTDDNELRQRLGKENATMQYANEILNRFYSDKEERLKYEAAFRYECDQASLLGQGREEGIRIGEAHGRYYENLQTARNMKARALDISLIQEITGLTAEEIAEM